MNDNLQAVRLWNRAHTNKVEPEAMAAARKGSDKLLRAIIGYFDKYHGEKAA